MNEFFCAFKATTFIKNGGVFAYVVSLKNLETIPHQNFEFLRYTFDEIIIYTERHIYYCIEIIIKVYLKTHLNNEYDFIMYFVNCIYPRPLFFSVP